MIYYIFRENTFTNTEKIDDDWNSNLQLRTTISTS